MITKTKDELVKWMWKEYPDVPNDTTKDWENYLKRSAMLEAYKFLIGKVDEDEIRRKAIAKSILKKIEKQNFYSLIDRLHTCMIKKYPERGVWTEKTYKNIAFRWVGLERELEERVITLEKECGIQPLLNNVNGDPH